MGEKGQYTRMPLIIALDAQGLERNSAGVILLIYRGPEHAKCYELRVSDQGVSPKLLKYGGSQAGALAQEADIRIAVRPGAAQLRAPSPPQPSHAPKRMDAAFVGPGPAQSAVSKG